MVKKLLLVCILAFSTTALFAESNSSKSEDSNKSGSSASIDAAFKLFKVMKQDVGSQKAVSYATKRLISANKNFKNIEPKIKDFYQKYIGWSAVKNDLAKLYTKYYSIDDLNNLSKFYETKTGQKVLLTMGKLSYEGQVLIQNRVKTHLSELKSILDAATSSDTNKTKTIKKEQKK